MSDHNNSPTPASSDQIQLVLAGQSAIQVSQARTETRIDFIATAMKETQNRQDRSESRAEADQRATSERIAVLERATGERILLVERTLMTSIAALEKIVLAYANQFRGGWKTVATIAAVVGFAAYTAGRYFHP